MITTLGLVAIILVLTILFQIARASDMLSALGGDEGSSDRNNKIQGTLFFLFMILGMVGAFWSAIYYAPLYLPVPSSEHGVWIRTMFQWTLVATVPVFVATHLVLGYFSFKYRGEKGKVGYYYPENHRLEMLWTVIPAVVMVVLVYEGMKNWYKIFEDTPPDTMIVETTGQQFLWTFRYSGADNKLGRKTVALIDADNKLGQDWSDKHNHDDFIADELHLPLGKEVLVKINSIDVLHSFYLPHFRVKMDAVPGIPTQFKFKPTKTTQQMRDELGDPDFVYELACAELCGQSHFNMRKVVVVEEEEEYNKWLATQKSTYAALQEKGIDTKQKLKKEDHHEEKEDHGAAQKNGGDKQSGISMN